MLERSYAASTEQPRSREKVLLIEDLEKRRERGGIAFVLVLPRFQLLTGTFVAIVGASGCGKSTLLDLLALILKPDRVARFEFHYETSSIIDVGALWMSDDEFALARMRANHMGYVLQTGGLLPFLTVHENIVLPARIKGTDGADDEARQLANELGIADRLTLKPQYLSGGQRQRVAIARALVHRPTVVLADEPTAAVDESRAKQIVHDLHRLAREHGTTVVMVTHDRNLVLPVADAVYEFTVSQVSDALTRSTCQLNPTTLGAGSAY
jgi:putative ABC transport system ATP-binding protein